MSVFTEITPRLTQSDNSLIDEKATSLGFQTSALLGNGATYDSGVLEIVNYQQVQTDVLSDVNGTIVIDFCRDSGGTDILRTLTIPYTGGEGYRLFSAPCFTPYVRYRFTADEAGQTDFYFDTKFLIGALSPQLLGLDAFVSPSMVASVQRSVMMGQTAGGQVLNVPVTQEGHIEVAVHDPRLPFGAVHTERLDPVFQSDAVYGLNPGQLILTSGTGGSTSGADNLFQCSTGVSIGGFSSIQSRKRLRYRPGQGIVARFTALYSTGVANSIQVAGVGTSESGVYFGYNGTSFGILHVTGGVREIQTLTITTASTDTNDYEITLDGVTTNVTATNNANTTTTAFEISEGTFPGWQAEQIGNTVIFVAGSVGNKTGSFSIAQTGAATPTAGSFAETKQGVVSTDTWIPQSSWNGDKLDGTGATGITLNPQNGNVFQINIQYLGFGGIVFFVETISEGNNPTFTRVHTLDIPNKRQDVSLIQPSFPYTMSAYSAGSTTDLTVKTASFAGFIEGAKKLNGLNITYQRETNGYVANGGANYYPLFTIRNDLVHGHGGISRANQSIIEMESMSCSHDDATPIIFFLIRNATLAGPVDFQPYSNSSCASWDTGATSCTITDNEQLVYSLNTGQASGDTIPLGDVLNDFRIEPGETITLAARAVTGTATYVSASLNTREDQ